ncbi:MAG: TRAP transporter substrate-binding protein DctP [Deltaproteobacteria bacterium]|jgi:TRAP-type C4-dicarboxylate transport system substrate-binding protein|nr:TRAP transporter substrate-binding protein DctP [Deltaproteobacteria bacterium]
MQRSASLTIIGLGIILPLLMLSTTPATAKTVVIKLATLAPEGSSWSETFNAIDAEIQQKTDGQVRFKLYAGGVLGDEKDMLRKMHIDQIHAAALTSAGLSAIFEEMDVFQIPFLFESHEEVDFVLTRMDAFFRQGFDKNNYVLLGWSEAGFVRLMSTKPVATLADLRKVKVWTWEDAPMTRVIFEEAGVSAIPLSVPDVLVGLQTGLVDVVYAPPSGAISLQWFTKTRYITDVNLIYLIGGVVIKKKVFNTIAPAHQKIVTDVWQRQMNRLKQTIRKENQEAMQVMVKQGIKIINPAPDQIAEFKKVSTKAIQRLEGQTYSQKTLNEVVANLESYRKKNQ